MVKKVESPWASGPAEILQHAVWLLSKDSDTNRRLAMILTDNAVEQMIKTYLSLPKRVTGIKISRNRYQEISENFPALLDALEEFAPEKLEGIDLGSIEWYHRLRNELYHQGMGLTVERDKVVIYAELANVLFRNLFSAEPPGKISDEAELLGRFIKLWGRLENAMTETASRHSLLGLRPRQFLDATRFLRGANLMPDDIYKDVTKYRQLRNLAIHGQADYKELLKKDVVERLEEIVKKYEEEAG